MNSMRLEEDLQADIKKHLNVDFSLIDNNQLSHDENDDSIDAGSQYREQ